MIIWRLVVQEKSVSLYELETKWSLDDLRRAEAVIEMMDYIHKKDKPDV
jgi:hypothetical protein